MGEKKKRVTKLDRLQTRLIAIASEAGDGQAEAAAIGRYDVAIIHQAYAESIRDCITLCNERPRNG